MIKNILTKLLFVVIIISFLLYLEPDYFKNINFTKMKEIVGFFTGCLVGYVLGSIEIQKKN